MDIEYPEFHAKRQKEKDMSRLQSITIEKMSQVSGVRAMTFEEMALRGLGGSPLGLKCPYCGRGQ